MKLKENFLKIAKITLVLTYLVIIAGAVVRMTGSGMGCPDWPKCFGYFVPPTEESQLEWLPSHEYKKGQVIILDESLKVATKSFTSSDQYSPSNWETYTKHDYAIFNPVHTWVEYINRLFGALAGLATLLMAIASLYYWKQNKTIAILSWLVVIGMGFQAWLGKTVVDSNLAPLKITTHMVMALAIVAVILYIIFIFKPLNQLQAVPNRFKNLLLIAFGLTLIQIIIGTQVRQFIDEQVKLLGDQNPELWLNEATIEFYVHRSFSILVLLVNLWAFILHRKHKLGFNKLNTVLLLLAFEVLSGIAMAYFHFPFGSQTIHLVLASILFGVQFYIILEAFVNQKKLQSL
ncbi:COX15/CtaA family protein [Mangrovimonas aestuarii]|uniref:COX15/CtaA family protein n=1 Tax=Mangrovimonas aestuarii TaxID=3018443 RepID=UPI002378B6E8|nr:COX15/CtaA family protein [Mangrovimonas aestuarii]